MKRSFSLDERVDESTPLRNFNMSGDDDGDALDNRTTSTTAAAALSRSYQQQHHFRPWEVNHRQSVEEATRGGAANDGKSDERLSSANHAKATIPIPSIAKATSNSPEHPSQHKPSLDPSNSFMSEPSASEEELETIGSSQFDFQKKMFYRQRLREFDAQSVGDTSLSSSNISTSPQPSQRFRFQFDNRIGKVRNKVKAASDRMSYSTMVLSSVEGNDNKTSRTTSLDGGARGDDTATLGEVPSPPTRASSEESSHKIGQVLSEDSHSSADSIRGISITTEQSGGENTSSSAMQIADTSDRQRNKYRKRESNASNASDSNGSRNNGSRHRRMHSGDAASALNSGGGDLKNSNSYRSREVIGSTKGNPSSWSNYSSSPFAHVNVDMDKSHWRTATWDGSREESTRSRTNPSAQPFIKSNTNLSLNNANDARPNVAPINPWLSPYQHPDGAQYHYATQNLSPEHDSYESDGSYDGTSESCSSSSYTDSYEILTDHVTGIRRSPKYRKVKFQSDKEDTKFDNAMRRVGRVLDKPLFRVERESDEANDLKKRPMFYCPNCKTKQRDIINFATAAGSFDSPQTYLAFYFGLYLVASLFVFGLEEGWRPLDCVYFSVITLTTTGLGDFVPSSDGAKIVCACFIYVGVATIGLLLGSLLVGSLDKAHKKEAREAQIRDCPNCLRMEKIKLRPSVSNADFNTRIKLEYDGFGFEHSDTEESDIGLDLVENDEELNAAKTPSFVHRPSLHLTRHMSIDLKADTPTLRKCFSDDDVPPPIDESTPFLGVSPHRQTSESHIGPTHPMGIRSMDDTHSSSSSSGTDMSVDSGKRIMTRANAAKYVFLTLKQALMNSLLVIAVGSVGYYYIEEMSAVDSFYFTTVLLTSVGYGDIVPVTTSGKLFTTFFSVVAGTVLLQNMTSIAMIPLELRKRRVEIAVLHQFGDQLTDDELRELSTGRLINRLKLATNRPYGLEECTREMFSLAMLVRLGRITEEDVKATFAAFRRLDVGNYGKLNSRTIIEGELMRRRSLRNLASLATPPEEWREPSRENMYMNQAAEFSLAHYDLPSQIPSHRRAPTPIPRGGAFIVHHGNSPESLVRKPSVDSYYSQDAFSRASSFDYNEYVRWASTFDLPYTPVDGRRNRGRSVAP